MISQRVQRQWRIHVLVQENHIRRLEERLLAAAPFEAEMLGMMIDLHRMACCALVKNDGEISR